MYMSVCVLEGGTDVYTWIHSHQAEVGWGRERTGWLYWVAFSSKIKLERQDIKMKARVHRNTFCHSRSCQAGTVCIHPPPLAYPESFNSRSMFVSTINQRPLKPSIEDAHLLLQWLRHTGDNWWRHVAHGSCKRLRAPRCGRQVKRCWRQARAAWEAHLCCKHGPTSASIGWLQTGAYFPQLKSGVGVGCGGGWQYFWQRP